MKIIRYTSKGKTGYGIYEVEEGTIRTNEALFGAESFSKMIEMLKTSGETEVELDVDAVRLETPVQPTKNVVCIGKNYYDHILEFDGTSEQVDAAKANPIFFTKAVSSIIGPEDGIDLHEETTSEVDYEGELGVVIGRPCRGVTPEEALEYVFGYTIINDVTARDLQRKHQQWFLGKGLDTFCPVGPYVVTKDEVEDPQDIEVMTKVNGEVRQQASTKLMMHSIASQISVISQGMTLNPGDVLATGTPQGVGMGFKPPRLLKKGDVVEISISGIGTLKNRVD